MPESRAWTKVVTSVVIVTRGRAQQHVFAVRPGG